MIKPQTFLLLSFAASSLGFVACTKSEIEIKPIEVKPIYITLDIRIQQQVNQSLQFVEQARSNETAAPTPAPAPAGN